MNTMKDWKAAVPPAGWNSPDPMPGTLPSDLEGQNRQGLEKTLLEVERAAGRMTDMLHDESGLKQFLRYFGTAGLGVVATLAVTSINSTSENGPPWSWIGGGAVLCLLMTVYGFMGQRQVDRTIVLNARGYDRERIIRALDQTENESAGGLAVNEAETVAQPKAAERNDDDIQKQQ